LNRGYEEVLTALAALGQHRAFPAAELERFAALSKENRASTNSFLLSIIESAETAEAGRRYHRRRRQEQQEEERSGS